MNGPLFDRPAAWGKAWQLYRRQAGQDAWGDPTAVYPEQPDASFSAGGDGAVAWQSEPGSTETAEPGERTRQTAAGCVFDASLEIGPFDRVAFDGALWEVRSVQILPGHRRVEVVRL